MRIRQAHLFLVLMFLVLLLYQCGGPSINPVYVRGGVAYGKVKGSFRHRWWNYYERGVSFADGRFFDEAIRDFLDALRRREDDQRMARTYGMHFIDYFPHRELGIVYFETGRLEQAAEELERSIRSFPSAKAYFYLDRVKKAIIKNTVVDIQQPRLVLDIKDSEFWTNQDPVVISGRAWDENYIAKVSIKSVPYFQEYAQKEINFKRQIKLNQGTHKVRVTARNLPGRTVFRDFLIHVDREGPVLTLKQVEIKDTVSGKIVQISGWIHDPAGVETLLINGKKINLKKGVEVPFTAQLGLEKDSLDFFLSDVLGNSTRASVPAVPITALRYPVLLADNSNFAGNCLTTGIFGPKDLRPPVIDIGEWDDLQTVFLEKAYIEGRIMDDNPIQSVLINGTPIFHRKGRYIFFSHLAELKKGENILLVEAVDDKGNRQTKKITIIRQIPSAMKLSSRLSLAALPFSLDGDASPAWGSAFQDSLIDAMINEQRFQMVERKRLNDVLRELTISNSDLADQRAAVKLGKLAAAQSIVIGSIFETRNGIEAVARLIDTETSDILSTQDVFGEVKSLPGIHTLAQGMSLKFHRDFPIMDGIVVARKGNAIFTDLGRNAVKLQRRLIIFREKQVSADKNKKRLGTDQKILGTARVTQVMEQMSKAKVLEAQESGIKFKAGANGGIMDRDRVITQ